MKPRPFAVESLWISLGLFVYKTVDKKNGLISSTTNSQVTDQYEFIEREIGSSSEHDHDACSHNGPNDTRNIGSHRVHE